MKSMLFQDFDAFAESVKGIDAVMMMQNPSSHRWAINEVVLPETHIQLGRVGSGNIIEGQSWSDKYMLYLPLTDACEYSANGTVLQKSSFAIFEPGCEFCFSTKFDHDWCFILVPADMFAASHGLGEPLSEFEKVACRATTANPQVAHQFRTLVNQTITAATSCPQFEPSLAAEHVEEELLKIAAVILGQRLVGQHVEVGRPRVPRQEIIRRCKQLFEEREVETIRLEELSAAADVSTRTLRRAFNEYYGVGPVRYLQIRQLHLIRRELKASDPDSTTVTGVLIEHGEWAFGRFASQYHRLFGELPSETLRAKRR